MSQPRDGERSSPSSHGRNTTPSEIEQRAQQEFLQALDGQQHAQVAPIDMASTGSGSMSSWAIPQQQLQQPQALPSLLHGDPTLLGPHPSRLPQHYDVGTPPRRNAGSPTLDDLRRSDSQGRPTSQAAARDFQDTRVLLEQETVTLLQERQRQDDHEFDLETEQEQLRVLWIQEEEQTQVQRTVAQSEYSAAVDAIREAADARRYAEASYQRVIQEEHVVQFKATEEMNAIREMGAKLELEAATLTAAHAASLTTVPRPTLALLPTLPPFPTTDAVPMMTLPTKKRSMIEDMQCIRGLEVRAFVNDIRPYSEENFKEYKEELINCFWHNASFDVFPAWMTEEEKLRVGEIFRK